MDAEDSGAKPDEYYRTVEAGYGYFCENTHKGFGLQGFISEADMVLITHAPDLADALKDVTQCLAAMIGVGQVSAKLSGTALTKAAELLQKLSEGRGA